MFIVWLRHECRREVAIGREAASFIPAGCGPSRASRWDKTDADTDDNYLETFMYPVNSQSEVATFHLDHDDIYETLAKTVVDDCLQSGEASSYRTLASDIFVRPGLMSEEPCVVVPLPGISSTRIPSTTALPRACVIREWTSDWEKGRAYLELRGGQVLVSTEQFNRAGAPIFVLFLFDDGPVLDIIPATEGVMTDIWAHEMSAQNYHPRPHDSGSDSPKDTKNEAFQLPIVARRAIVVSACDAESEDGSVRAVEPEHEATDFDAAKQAKSACRDNWQDAWTDVIPFPRF
ncbi:hypothetical protein [Burkholderia sp. PU8-34]